MVAPIPLTIISGFLGAGKTALLNHLLTEAQDAGGRRITALVNDFGALNIDAELIAAQHGNQIALANGCVCCSINDDLARALAQSLAPPPPLPLPDHIVIEASGVADPARIALFADVDAALRLDGIITLIDAAAHHTHAHDPYLADTYARQINAADFFLINKTDLASTASITHLQTELTLHHPHIPQACITHGQFASDVLLGLAHSASNNTTPASPAPLPEHGLRRWATHLSPLCRHRLQEKLYALAPHLLRAKGILADQAGAYIIHYAGGRVHIEDNPTANASGHFMLIGKPDLPDSATLAHHFTSA